MKRTVIMVMITAVGLSHILGCGAQLGARHFAGPVLPSTQQVNAQMEIGDDRSVTYLQGRLEVNLRPLTDDILNRDLAHYGSDASGFYQNPYAMDPNPFTYGDYVAPEYSDPTQRFTVFRLKIKNYEYPKVLLDPREIYLNASNGRQYQSLTLSALVEYYWPYAVGYAGNARKNFDERKDILIDKVFRKDDPVFSGQETEGYIVFPPLHKDVESFEVVVKDVAVRFDFRGEPIETIDVPYQFRRDVYVALEPKQASQ